MIRVQLLTEQAGQKPSKLEIIQAMAKVAGANPNDHAQDCEQIA